MPIKDKFCRIKPWERLDLSRKEYAATKPWKTAKMKRAVFEDILLMVPDELIQEWKLEGQADFLLKSILGEAGRESD